MRRFVFGLLLLFASTSATVAQRIPIPDGVFYYQPASTVFGGEAAWVNPAGLARYHTAGYQLMGEMNDYRDGLSWGALLHRERLAVAYRQVDNVGLPDFKEWLGAGALSMGQLSVGGSYRYFTDGPSPYHNRHYWNVGLMLTGTGRFSMGAVFSNLNRGKIMSTRTETEMRYSLGYRPSGQRVTIAADMLMSTGQSIGDADFVYHVEAMPWTGFYVNAFADHDGTLQFGVRANFARYFLGGRSTFSKGDHARSLLFLGATSGRQPSLIDEQKRRLSMSMSGGIEENPEQPIFGPRRTAFLEVIEEVYRAADDPSISEMLLKLRNFGIGFARAQELREALLYFRAQGKSIVCHVESPTNLSYYVASATDSILIPPVSQLNLVGLRAELTFYAETLEKLGVKLDMVRIGDYKSGTEPWTRSSPTDEYAAQINAMLDDWYAQFTGAIAAGRGLTVDSVKSIIDNGPFTSAEALEYGLVDGLSYRDRLKENEFVRGMPEVSFHGYRRDTLLNDGWPAEPIIGVVVADGEIEQTAGGFFDSEDYVTPSLMKRGFGQATAEPMLRGLVLRIDSPGGRALAGNEIYHDMEKPAKKYPLVTSMSNIAASGGYHIAMHSKKLFASPSTVTGSIGIYGGKADLSGLYEKIDLYKYLYKRGEFAGMMSQSRPFTEAEREKYREHLFAFYDHFIGLVAENRGLEKDSIDQIARGRTFTGETARQIGLVDSLGGIHQAIQYIADTAGLDSYRVCIYPRRTTWFRLPGVSVMNLVTRAFGGSEAVVYELERIKLPEVDGLMARLPYDIVVE